MKYITKTFLSALLIFGFIACNSSITENTDDELVDAKRREISNLIDQYKEYGIVPLPLSETEVKEMDMGKLTHMLEFEKHRHEISEARKNSPEAKLTNLYVEKMEATASEEGKRELLNELLEEVIKLRAASSEEINDKPTKYAYYKIILIIMLSASFLEKNEAFFPLQRMRRILEYLNFLFLFNRHIFQIQNSWIG
ncbi:hypothetical protein [Anditalea andensis]|nr:hypothetical protein [Anditalea andensis]